MKCLTCGEEIGYSVDRCYTCGADVGAPNVRIATTAIEKAALQKRYDDAVYRAASRGATSTLEAFEKALERSAAVINCNLSFLKDFVSQPNSLYSGYHLVVQSETRKPKSFDNDQERAVVDAIMFRGYGTSIRFAALSVNELGLSSYGPYAMTLKDVAVCSRASLLEENSFKFVEHHGLGPKTPIPAGFRGDWNSRKLLAVAKLGDLLDVGPQPGGFAKLLLDSNGNFDADEFIEIHIYGPFDFSAVECISGPIPTKRLDRGLWTVVKEIAHKAGKKVNEF